MNWTPLNLTVRVGCNLIYQTTVRTHALFVLRPRLEGNVLVVQEKLTFGIGQPSYEFQDSHGNITYRSTLMPGRRMCAGSGASVRTTFTGTLWVTFT